MIRLEAVSVALGGAVVLDAIDLAFAPGSIAALIGPPGVGKTCLLKTIAGLVLPSRGSVFVFGEDLAALEERGRARVRKRLGMVFQNDALFDSRTIFENVAFPLRRADAKPSEDEIRRRVTDRLEELGLAGTESQYPHELSGGMRKRAGIARATVADPTVRLYDDPTAGLDPVTSARILALIGSIHERGEPGVTIIASNDMDTLLPRVPRVVMLSDGRVAYDGPTGAILGSSGPALVRNFVRGEAGESETHEAAVDS